MDLPLAQRVNKRFNAVITHTTQLQRQLFFIPDSNATRINDIFFNYYVRDDEAFAYLDFTPGGQRQLVYYNAAAITLCETSGKRPRSRHRRPDGPSRSHVSATGP